MDLYRPEETQRWPLADDLTEQHNILYTIDQDELPPFQPYFDPTEFAKRNPNLNTALFRLTDENLKEIGNNVSKIRKQIIEKAISY